MSAHSVTVWLVKPGHEDEFVQGWRELAELTSRQMTGRKEQTLLLRDHDQPNRFVSVAPWDSAATLRAWRSGPVYSARVAQMSGILEDVMPMTLDDVTQPAPVRSVPA